MPCCYGDTVIIKLNILGALLIKKPICTVRFIKNPSGGIKKLGRAWGDGASIFQYFSKRFRFLCPCLQSTLSPSFPPAEEKILDRNILQYRFPVDGKRLSFRRAERNGELSRAGRRRRCIQTVEYISSGFGIREN